MRNVGGIIIMAVIMIESALLLDMLLVRNPAGVAAAVPDACNAYSLKQGDTIIFRYPNIPKTFRYNNAYI